ncbi:trans-sulfuration enzyme family protein [Mesohalobacter halotolerans]|uniref:PLP-dependent transferase n=1 Tax=Mesohalobacter halotolerans TaxID=1883405 RepID=A0A4U5TQA2_9FLAO|nr:PLP-dependent aspartate aminotransferase family protein [Mesohalobacter halotolerans]MBS3738955.1 PLP-dependent transferase [Psychroflexus sp.]TKS56380.1 PLP-dependent transferase [Mesohalobacter halotolerans]
MKKNYGLNTICVHEGEVEDKIYKGAVSPIFPATAYAYHGAEESAYPRYFNTPNQANLAKKIAKLEHTEAGLIFGSGMAAISSAMLSVLKSGDHVIVQNQIYGGTRNFIKKELESFNVEYDFVDLNNFDAVKSLVTDHTKLIYLETPSNPLLELVDLKQISNLAKKFNLLTMADNTFATPINQRPIDFGIDIVVHSATKYLGGHSDITAGAVATTKKLMQPILLKARNFGGSLADQTTWLLERSMKTLNLRVQQQSHNAMAIAEYLNQQDWVKQVFYPGIKTHHQHELAKMQMSGFGGMLSFELDQEIPAISFLGELKLIKDVLSLGGVETTILSPTKTSHSLLSESERQAQGITTQLLRLSCGIENHEDIINDIKQAVGKIT